MINKKQERDRIKVLSKRRTSVLMGTSLSDKSLFLVFLFFIFIFSFSLVSSLPNDDGASIDFTYNPSINYSTINTNYSLDAGALQGYTWTSNPWYQYWYNHTADAISYFTSQIANYVPYTGATQDVDLNGQNLSNVSQVAIGKEVTSSNALDVYGDVLIEPTTANGVQLYSSVVTRSALYWINPNVAHGMTNFVATNVASYVRSLNNDGGMIFAGFTEDGDYPPMTFRGYIGAGSTTNPAVIFEGHEKTGTGSGPIDGDEIVIQFRNTVTPIMTMTGNNYVGVRTSTPITPLHVNGATTLIGNLNQAEGNATYNSFYGGMWMHNDTGLEGTFNSTYQKIYFDNSNNDNGFIFHSNNALQLKSSDGAGLYQAIYKLEGNGVQNHEYHSYVYVNEVQQNNTIGHAIGQASTSVQMHGLGMIRLANEDNVTVRIADLTAEASGTQIDANINLVRIAN